MNPLTWLLLAPLALGLIWCLWALWRERDLRIGLVAALLAALVGRQLLDAPLGNEPIDQLALAQHLSGLVVDFVTHVLASLAAVAISRSVVERNRAEQIHWESMEAFRALASFVNAPNRIQRSFDEAVDELLCLGCKHFGTEIGLLARIEGSQYHVVAVRGPQTFPVSQGECLAVDDTFCRQTLERDQVVAVEDTAARHWVRQAGRASPTGLGFGSYLAAPVHVADTVFGTLCFASGEAHHKRFAGSDKELLGLMAHWVGNAIAVRDAWQRLASAQSARTGDALAVIERSAAPDGKPTVQPGGATSPRYPARPTHATNRRCTAVDATVAALEEEIRAAATPGVRVVLDLAASRSEVRMFRYEFERLLWSLVLQAAELADGRGELHVETRRLAQADAGPARDAFVTLGVRATNAALDADAMSELLDRDLPASRAASRENAAETRRVSLPRIRQLLRVQGGDLSTHSGESEGTTLTSYLPALPLPSDGRTAEKSAPAATPFATG